MIKDEDYNNIDPEMYSFLKEHFIQGTIVTMEAIKRMVIDTHRANVPNIQKLPEDFASGWNHAFNTIADNLEKITKTFPSNELTDEDQFDKLSLKFKQAFPKQ